jgi:hypothetical protein
VDDRYQKNGFQKDDNFVQHYLQNKGVNFIVRNSYAMRYTVYVSESTWTIALLIKYGAFRCLHQILKLYVCLERYSAGTNDTAWEQMSVNSGSSQKDSTCFIFSLGNGPVQLKELGYFLVFFLQPWFAR